MANFYLGHRPYDFVSDDGKQITGATLWFASDEDVGNGYIGFEAFKESVNTDAFALISATLDVNKPMQQVALKYARKRLIGVTPSAKS